MYTVECSHCQFCVSDIGGWRPPGSAHAKAERIIAEREARAIADRHESDTKHRGPFIWWKD